ncbi:MAG: hypothetical protein J5623_01215 [Clostridiales bacterium]|nr:hypothetical protein [Clostridiales bacterium]
MDLSSFSDLYIITECLLLEDVLKSTPRYRIGLHRGKQVIREYSGHGENRIKKLTLSCSRKYSSMHEKLEQYNKLTERKNLFDAEFSRRRLTVPAGFRLQRDTSPHNMEFWKQQVPCSNNYENKNRYVDAFGFNVKSRSEMLVGQALKELGLEAKYEPLLILRGDRKKTPDYSFPVPVIDRCFYVEFMGMADNESYIDKNYGKIEEYMRNGILLNRDLIVICGTENWLPSLEDMKRIIASFINNAVSRVYEQHSSGHSN